MNRSERALAMVGDLTSASTVARSVDLFQLALEPFGVNLFRAQPVVNQARPLNPESVETNWSKEWTDFYNGKRAFTFDPTVRAAYRCNEGFFWRDLPAGDGRGRELMRDAASIGMVEGFVAMRQLPGELKTTVYLTGERQFEWSSLEQGVVSFVANTLMSRLLYLRDIALTPAVQTLSDREVEVLHHAAVGHGDKEIARALEIGFTTVRYHWTSIHRKLGTLDRANAVAVGLWSGQIAP